MATPAPLHNIQPNRCNAGILPRPTISQSSELRRGNWGDSGPFNSPLFGISGISNSSAHTSSGWVFVGGGHSANWLQYRHFLAFCRMRFTPRTARQQSLSGYSVMPSTFSFLGGWPCSAANRLTQLPRPIV